MQFREFWPAYLHAHSRRSTRALHYVATSFFGFMAAIAAAMEEAWMVPAGIAGSYAIAVSAHWCFEGNQPLVLVHPIWGAVADLRMCWLALTGRLGRELVKCRVPGYGSGPPRNGEARRDGPRAIAALGAVLRRLSRPSETRPN